MGFPFIVANGLCCFAFARGLLSLFVCLPSRVTTGNCGCSFDPLCVPLPLCLTWFELVLVLVLDLVLVLVLDLDFVHAAWALLVF